MTRLQEVLACKPDNYILPFFWQHGEDEATLREYMQAIHALGIGAVCVESRPHPDFAGPKWWADMDVILDEARRMDMKVWILDDSHFPTGFANGAVKNAPEELTHLYMVHRTLEVSGPAAGLEFEVAQYMKEAPLPPWIPQPPKSDRVYSPDTLVKILACPLLPGEKLGAPIDLTDCVDDRGICRFDLPNGFFKIYVIRLTRQARGRNDYINFLDKDSCRLLIDAVYEPHYAHYAENFGKTIAGFFSDEPPVGNTEGYTPSGPIGSPNQNLPWSAAAAARMSAYFGSDDWYSSLPYLWAEAADPDAQAKVRSAYMNMASRLVQECFSMQLGAWCEAHGAAYIGHMLEDCDMNSDLGISMGHYFRGLYGQHMSGIDNIGGQVMINAFDLPRHPAPACADEAGFYQYMLGKMGASLGAIDPKKAGRTMCENFGAYGWQSGTREQKFMMDHFMVRGVNRFVPHAFSPAPFPDPDCPPHFYAHGENPLYRAFGELMRYTNRVCHLIDGGHACPDTAILYNGESKWAGGAASNIPACRVLTMAQIDYHILPTDVFTGTEYPMTFDGHMLNVNGTDYPSLTVCGCDYVEKPAADFIVRAMEAGFPVIFLEKKPHGVSDGTPEDNERLTAALVSAEAVPVSEAPAAVRKALACRGILPQCVVTSHTQAYSSQACSAAASADAPRENSALAGTVADAARLVTYHYQRQNADQHQNEDLWLVLNENGGQAFDGTLSVSLPSGTVPVWYDPWQNRLVQAQIIREESAAGSGAAPCRTDVRLHLEPLQLMILAAVDEGSAAQAVCEKTPAADAVPMTIDRMTVRRIDAPAYLKDRKAALDSAVPETVAAPYEGMQLRYPDFAGYYIYEADLDLDPACAYRLQIDNVCEAAEVFVDGQSLGMRLQAPFAFEIPAADGGKMRDLAAGVGKMRDLAVGAVKLRDLTADEGQGASARRVHLVIETATLIERKTRTLGANDRGMTAARPYMPTGIVGNVTVTPVG